MRVIFHYPAGLELARRLADLATAGLEVAVAPPDDEAAFARQLPRCEALWHVLKPVTRAMIEAAPSLRLIQKMGAGVDTIDLEAARGRGVAVCNLPGSNAQAVAEQALALMLAVLRKGPQFDSETKAGVGWRWPQTRQAALGEISGRTVGLVGFGATASRLAPALAALGARVLYASRRPVPGATAEHVGLDDLLERAHIVSLHLPLTETTQGLIDATRIARMRPGAILINTARGGLVDQKAMVAALASGRLAGAGLDTFAVEPIDAGDPLLALDTVVVSPHVAWLTLETFERSFSVMAENCRRLTTGEPLLHRIV